MERGPIYVGGAERSGTSLIYALLASHPNIAMTRRTNLWAYFYNQYGDLANPENLDRCLTAMSRYKRLAVVRPDFDRLREDFWQGEPTYGRLFALIEQQYADREAKPRWGDKSLNTERYANFIFAAYPNAKIIHMIRDPRDRYASALKRWKVIRGGAGSGTGMWLESVKLGEHNLKRFPSQYMILRYETLAYKPEETLREVCDFIGEEYTPMMLSMQGAENFRDEGGNSSFEQHQPGDISTRSIGRYRKYLAPRSIAFMQTVAGKEMTAHDYPIEPLHLSLKDRIFYNLYDLPINLARMAIWRYRESYLDRKGRSLPAYRIIPEAKALVM
jgi:hypothetical protein